MKTQGKGFTAIEITAVCAMIAFFAYPAVMGVIRSDAQSNIQSNLQSNSIMSPVSDVINIFMDAQRLSVRDCTATSVNISKRRMNLTQTATVDGKSIVQTIRSIVPDKRICFHSNYPILTFGSDGVLNTDTSILGEPPMISIIDGVNEVYLDIEPTGLVSVTPMKTL